MTTKIRTKNLSRIRIKPKLKLNQNRDLSNTTVNINK